MDRKNTTTLDFETRLIGKNAIAPKPVVLSVYDGPENHYLTVDMERVMGDLLESNATLVWHNAAFDMTVAYTHFEDLRELIFKAYDEERIKCTKVREMLLHLSVVGHLNNPKSLAACMMRYFKVDISDAKTDPNAWRLRYSELEGVAVEDYPDEARDYALSDTACGDRLYWRQEEINNGRGTCSIGSEGLQTYFDFIARLMTIKGFAIDKDLVLKTKAELEERAHEPLDILVNSGYASIVEKTGKVSIREKMLREYLTKHYPAVLRYSKPSKTFPNGQVSLAAENIIYYPKDPLIDSLKEYNKCRKLLTTYLPNLLRGPTIHPQFNVLVETGRTSSHGHAIKRRDEMFPSENVQNLPRGGNVREAHIARPGKVLVFIDYKHLELDTLAQVTYEMFGKSKMLELINAGKDPHCLMGAQLLSLKEHGSVTYDEFAKRLREGDPECKAKRQAAKAANFGFPGGLGAKKMIEYARVTFGIDDMTLPQARELRAVFLDTFPEVQQLFDWYALQEGEDGWEYESSGRWRARCSYCVGLNGIGLQSRSADGAKYAGILLARACALGDLEECDVLAFVHDEYGLEMPNDERLPERIGLAETYMLEGMQRYLSDVCITVESDAMLCWAKSGPFIYSSTKSIAPKGGVIV